MSMRMGIGREEGPEAKLRSVGNVIRKGLLRDAAEFVRKGNNGGGAGVPKKCRRIKIVQVANGVILGKHFTSGDTVNHRALGGDQLMRLF